MTPDERVVLLKEMLPNLTEWIYQCLASDHAVSCSNGLENDITRKTALIDVMARLRFNDAKVQRVRNHCGLKGSDIIGSAYWAFTNRLRKAQGQDLLVSTQVLHSVDVNDEETVEAATKVVNELNETRDNKYEPLKFDVNRALKAIEIERYMWTRGIITHTTDPEFSMAELRRNLNRWERFPHQTIDELFGRDNAPSRSNYPNTLFSDGKFGDGTEMVSMTGPDGEQRWVRSSRLESVLPAFEGMNRMEIEEAIRAKIEAAKKEQTD